MDRQSPAICRVAKQAASGLACWFLSVALCVGAVSVADVAEERELTSKKERIDALRIVAEHMEANFSAIKTWTGSFRLQEELVASGPFAKTLAGGIDAKPPLIARQSGLVEFVSAAIDDSVFTTMQLDGPPTVMEKDTGRLIETSHLDTFTQKSILTAEQHFFMHPDSRLGQLGRMPKLATLPQGGAPVAVRDSPRDISGPPMGSLVDPRHLFGVTGPHWEFLTLAADALASDAEADSMVKVYEFREGPSVGYRFVFPRRNGIILQWVAASEDQFNAREYLQCASDGTPEFAAYWKYEANDGVLTPRHVCWRRYGAEGTQVFERVLTAVKSVINEVVPEDAFSLRALGVTDGTRVLDKIDDKLLVYEDGELVPVEEYNLRAVSGIGH